MSLVLRECVPLPEIISLIGTCKVDSTLSTRGYFTFSLFSELLLAIYLRNQDKV